MKKGLLALAVIGVCGIGSAYAQEATPKPTPQHVFRVMASVDVRGWVHAPLQRADSVSGQNLNPDGRPALGRPVVGDVLGGARLTSTYVGFHYIYGSYVGANLVIQFDGQMTNFRSAEASSTIAGYKLGLREALVWVDPLGIASVNEYVGLKISAGYLFWEPLNGLTAPSWMGSAAISFDMNTTSRFGRAMMADQLLWRIDMPINAMKETLDLTFSVTSDLDFSVANAGWTILSEVTINKIKMGRVATMGLNAHYHHWRSGNANNTTTSNTDPSLDWEADRVPWQPDLNAENHSAISGENNLSGRGKFGSHLLGGSANISFNLPQSMSLTFGVAGEYQWFYGESLIQRYDEDFNSLYSSGRTDQYYATRKGSASYEGGVRFHLPNGFTFYTAYVHRVTGNFGFSHDEGIVGLRGNTFIATRLDLLVLNSLANLQFYGGISVGILEARRGFWDQVGRIGWEVGLAWRPVATVRIRAGWQQGSHLLGQIANPSDTRSKDGNAYLRMEWSLRP
jgi:hypothetical protein